MIDEKFGLGLLAGGVLVGIPLAIGASWFLDRSYNEGLRGARLAQRGIFFKGHQSLFGRTFDGGWVSVPHFERGRAIRIRFQNLEQRIFHLEQAYGELKVGYTFAQSRIEELARELKEMWSSVSKIPELRQRIEQIHAKLVVAKKQSIS